MPDWEELPLLSNSAPPHDDAGNILGAQPIDAASGNIDPRISDFILYGVFNGAFARGPLLGVGSAIGDENPMPDWSGPTQVSGGAITCSWVADSSSPSGYNLRFAIAPGAAGDEAYVEQVVPVASDRLRTNTNLPRGTFYRVTATGGQPQGTLSMQYLKADGTTTGSAITATVLLASDATLYGLTASVNTQPPADAALLRLRLGVKRGSMTASDTATIDLVTVRTDRSGRAIPISEIASPGTYGPGYIYQSGGLLTVIPARYTHGAPTLDLDASTGEAAVVSATQFRVAGAPLVLEEQAAPATPAADAYAIYAKTDGILYGKNDAGTEVAFGGGGASTVIRPSISATQDDWAPTGLADNCVIIVDLNAANRTITGLSALADGAHVELMAQSSTNTISLSHLSASSAAANQFRCPAGVAYVVGNKAGVRLVYDATDDKWRIVGPA